MRQFRDFIAALAVSAACSATAFAAPTYPLDQLSPAVIDYQYGGDEIDAVRGYTFQVNGNGVNVTQLGALFPVNQAVTLSLFDVTTGSNLAQIELDYTGGDNDEWQFVDLLAPVALTNGGTYFVGAFGAALWYWNGIGIDSGLLPTGTIDYVSMNFCSFCSADTLPTDSLSEGLQGFVDIGYEVAAVPEPGTVALLGAGLLGLMTARRRQ